MKGGRARWRIENETFNTLKNQGYHFEPNFGHGPKMGSYVCFWESFRAYFFSFKLPDWVTLYQAIYSSPVVELPVFDTS
jgi:hypothetical protein